MPKPGKPCADFAAGGEINTQPLFKEHYPELQHGQATFSSPPAVIGDVVIFGSSNNVRNGSVASPRGTVRAFDARTGEFRWTFDPVPYDPQDPQHSTWTKEALDVTTGANAWSMLSVDEERDLVFVPNGSASPDPYGGLRPGDNRYANSVVALRGSTGEVVWHFQTIHHDVWGLGFAGPAHAGDHHPRGARDSGGRAVDQTRLGVCAQPGRPASRSSELRSVPLPTEGAVPGEMLSPTQPFPLKPEPLIKTGITPDDAWGLTFWDRGKCRAEIENAHYGSPVHAAYIERHCNLTRHVCDQLGRRCL